MDWLVGWLIDLNSCCADITGDKQYRFNMYLRLHIAPTGIRIPIRCSERKSSILVICETL